ncbi:MAG: putative pyridine nucleotide-disulfide oxidoreductase [Rubritepida sp.]|nr:putative pyridine nucleotide-disulfide oxidoreductase [Rubritepida sp.]
MREVALLVLGAGPAGLAAATEARSQGLDVLLLDENAAPGGQVHRGVGEFYRPSADAPGAAQAREGLALIEAARASGAEMRGGATFWAIEDDLTVSWSEGGTAHQARAGRVILCPGAVERALPIPGWTLPGVMGVGAAQILLKTAGLVPEGRTWMAGQGPLLWLYAAQLLAKGGTLAGIIDMSPAGAWRQAIRHLPMALMKPGPLLQGLSWMRRVRADVPVIRARDVEALGDGKLRGLRFDGREEAADLLLLHDGVVPNTQVTRALQGCAHVWDAAQASFRPVLDEWGNASLPGVMVAGDGGGIGGARAAALSGRIAAIEAARALGRLTAEQRDAAAGRPMLRRRSEMAPRAFLDALFPPLGMDRVADGTVVCRCEEVTAGRVRAAVSLGAQGPNQLKAFLRAGMGPCQGRVCGPVVHALVASSRGIAAGDLMPLRTRFPVKPITVAELATLK